MILILIPALSAMLACFDLTYYMQCVEFPALYDIPMCNEHTYAVPVLHTDKDHQSYISRPASLEHSKQSINTDEMYYTTN